MLEAEWRQDMHGSVSMGAKEGELSTGCIWAAGFHCYGPFSLGRHFETYKPFISLISQFFFGGGGGKLWINETEDTESADTEGQLYVVVLKIFWTGATNYMVVVVARSTVDGRTTMSSESACQVARSWMDMGSYHMRLLGVMYVTCGDFQNGSEKGTVSVHQILCQS
jgi:hypothetical protein